jgi:prepilin-type N-terminal cleavage/methylation domain-containing protein
MRRLPYRRSRAVQPGFTLLELLVTITIIAILAVLTFSITRTMMANGRKAKGMANLRQVSSAMGLYANENNNTLPGPCTFGVLPYYNWNAIPLGALAGFLAPYLGYPDLKAQNNYSSYETVQALVSPGLANANPQTLQTNAGIPHYIQNNSLKLDGASVRVLGSVTAPWIQQPLRMTDLVALGGPESVWILSDVDQDVTANSMVTASGWYSKLPLDPVYGSVRLRLYGDGHVGAIDKKEQP